MPKHLSDYPSKMGAWGEAVAQAAFTRNGYTAHSQPLENRIPYVDMQVKRGTFRAQIQVKATGERGKAFKFDFMKMRSLLAYVSKQGRFFRFGFAVVNCRQDFMHVFGVTYLSAAFDRANERTPHNELPGSVSLVYADSSPSFPLLVRERREGISICRAYSVNDAGGWTGDMFED